VKETERGLAGTLLTLGVGDDGCGDKGQGIEYEITGYGPFSLPVT
jgi:hypothetical protein